MQTKQLTPPHPQTQYNQTMTEIKLSDDLAYQNQEELRPRVNLKAAIRLAEKQQHELINKISRFHDPSCLKPIIDYLQQRSQLQKVLDFPAEDRNRKILKAIKAELSYLRCFQIHSEDDLPKELLCIMKRDLDMFTTVISKFVHAKLWPKGSLLQTVAHQRDKLRVLLRGEVAVFQPINYNSYKNCLKLYQADKARNQLIAAIFGFVDQTVHYDSQNPLSQNPLSQLLGKVNPEQFDADSWQTLNSTHRTLSLQTAKHILKLMNIITVATPHRMTAHLKTEGQLICSELHPLIIDQQEVYKHTAICLSECYVMQLQYEVYRQAISHLNSDEEKRYIQILLRKFEMMEYFDAKQYVKPEFMIDRMRQQAEEKQKLQEATPISLFQRQLMLNEGRDLPKNEEVLLQEEDNNNNSKKKQETDLECYPIVYDNDLYLIIEGEVTITIDIIEETRLSTFEHASKIRLRRPRPILKLYQGDIFGFEEIGKTKDYNLTYFVRKDSKILLMAEEIYVPHFSEIKGFRDELKEMQSKRNQLLSNILKNLQKTINQQQLKKYKSVSLLERTRFNGTPVVQTVKNEFASFLPAHLTPPRQLQFLGNKDYEKEERKLMQNIIKQKQANGTNVALQKLVKNSTSLRQSLTFVSTFKNTISKNSKVIGNYIEIRNEKGSLLRKRSIVDCGRQQLSEKDNFFRKIGVITAEQRNQHNLNIIRRRKSKYEIGEFGQQEKELKRLKNIAMSLPKMKNFYAKKEDVLYNNLHKLDYQKIYT